MDDLLDLSWSSSTPPIQQQQQQPQARGKSAFDYLASTNSRSASPVSLSPSFPTAPVARSVTPLQASVKTTTANGSTGRDAFSSLFGDSASTSSSASQNLPMAQRINTLNKPPSRQASPVQLTSSEPWDFDFLSTKASSPSASSPLNPALVTRTASPLPKPNTDAGAADDFDFAFDPVPVRSPEKKPLSRKLDFDESQQIRIGDEEEEEASSLLTDLDPAKIKREAEEILGSLAQAPLASSSRTSLRKTTSSKSRSLSPPPHVLGQLVEMGFAIPASRSALLATYKDSNWDVQAAAESILGNSRQPSPRFVNDPPVAVSKEGRSRQRQDVESERPNSATSNQTQADLLAQASEIGSSLFKQANAYWKTGRKVVQKAYDERIVAVASSASSSSTATSIQNGSSNISDARPKWMRDLPVDDQDEDWTQARKSVEKEKANSISKSKEKASTDLFKDSDDEDSGPPRNQSRAPIATTSAASPAPAKSTIPRIYQSSARRAVPQRSNNASPATRTPASPQPAIPKVYSRPEVTCTPAQLATSANYRKQGNEHFKLGRYAEAEAAYTSAITALPSSHLATLSALNNRASSRLKQGNERAAIEDATTVLTVVLVDLDSLSSIDCQALDHETATIVKAKLGEEHAPNLREAIAKALIKRAQGYEASEKYALAVKDYEVLLAAGEALTKPAGGVRIVSEGLTRSKKAAAPKASPVASAPKLSKPKPAMKKLPVSTDSSEKAVNALRANNQAAEEEDAVKFSLKESVDERILTWKAGKESNIRALVGSLETVLWPELEWKKVGMHELISEGQLKVRYMRAISKLHPDKLDVNKTTVEQRMIANAVFSALNDAWNASR